MKSHGLFAIGTVTALAILPLAAGSVMWDYTLTYMIDDLQQTTSFSVSGAFVSHPECSGWSISSPASTTTNDPNHLQRYRISLAFGMIEQVVQQHGVVTTYTLTCPGGHDQVLNPIGEGPYHTNANLCGNSIHPVTPDSDVTTTAIPGTPNPSSSTDQELWRFANICVTMKAGTREAPVPFTGRVWSYYEGSEANGRSHVAGQICSELIVGGVKIGVPVVSPVIRCAEIQNHPTQNLIHYRWEVEPQGLEGQEDLNLGIGSYGGSWLR